MKYYCENCGTEYNFGDGAWDIDDMCPICGKWNPDFALLPIPDYETPEQYKKRTGKPWPNDGPVWIKRNDGKEYPGGGFWGVCRYKTSKDMGDKVIACVQGPNPPPNDWRSEA